MRLLAAERVEQVAVPAARRTSSSRCGVAAQPRGRGGRGGSAGPVRARPAARAARAARRARTRRARRPGFRAARTRACRRAPRTRSACPGLTATRQKTSLAPSSASVAAHEVVRADRDTAGRHEHVGSRPGRARPASRRDRRQTGGNTVATRPSARAARPGAVSSTRRSRPGASGSPGALQLAAGREHGDARPARARPPRRPRPRRAPPTCGALRGLPASTTTAPAVTSPPRGRTFSPGSTCSTDDRRPVVCSTGTTASAPSGHDRAGRDHRSPRRDRATASPGCPAAD